DRPELRLVWIRGNHDGPADIISHIVGVDILDEYIFENNQIRLLIIHGDQFDSFITRFRWLTDISCRIFYSIQKWAPHRTARWIRRISKKWQRNSQLVEAGAIAYAQTLGCRYVTCGHTHLPLVDEVQGIRYFNTGTWTDHPPCPFLVVSGASVRLETWPRESDANVSGRSEAASTPGSATESIAPAPVDIIR
ncbi:MAG TPA: UDP-2,3-diacylglucosamine diphosphatase, partial [Isosphaeraceae bacterium]|nr:UDP-2,3-diacylglucosamine diphosphatase [Isosphaeraceae bacterium]